MTVDLQVPLAPPVLLRSTSNRVNRLGTNEFATGLTKLVHRQLTFGRKLSALRHTQDRQKRARAAASGTTPAPPTESRKIHPSALIRPFGGPFPGNLPLTVGYNPKLGIIMGNSPNRKNARRYSCVSQS